MKKGNVFLGLIIFIILILFFFIFKYSTIKSDDNGIIKNIQVTDLKDNNLPFSNYFDDNLSLVIIYLDTKCGVCRELINEVLIEKIIDRKIIILSVEDLSSLRELHKKIPNKESISILKTDYQSVFKIFGGLGTPQILIYNPLSKKFEPGKIEDITQ